MRLFWLGRGRRVKIPRVFPISLVASRRLLRVWRRRTLVLDPNPAAAAPRLQRRLHPHGGPLPCRPATPTTPPSRRGAPPSPSSAAPSPSSGSSAASIPIDGRLPRRPATPAPPLSPLTGSSLAVQVCFPRRLDLIPTAASCLTLLSPSQSSSSHCRVKSWRTTTDLRRGRPKKR